jgi:hydrogenase maturation protease
MSAEATPVRGRVIIIGYGNTLRSDDGAGIRIAEAVAAWNRTGLTARPVHQLTPELAAPLAAADLAIFADARLAKDGEATVVMPLDPSSAVRTVGHTSDPRELLRFARSLYGRSPRAWLISVPAPNLSLGESLSATASRGIEDALVHIRRLLEHVMD